jgi:hypothetical protein
VSEDDLEAEMERTDAYAGTSRDERRCVVVLDGRRIRGEHGQSGRQYDYGATRGSDKCLIFLVGRRRLELRTR